MTLGTNFLKIRPFLAKLSCFDFSIKKWIFPYFSEKSPKCNFENLFNKKLSDLAKVGLVQG